jgi:DNA polymerase delta subunit 2
MVACLGVETDKGNRFVVEDYCYSAFPPQKSISYANDDNFVVLISGLGFSMTMSKDLTAAHNNMVNYLSGSLGVKTAAHASQISRVIIAGNLIGKTAREQEKKHDDLKNAHVPEWARQDQCYTMEALRLADDFLARLGATMSVDVMPGPLDATSIIMPQQPMHPCVLPKASALTSVRSVTNPYSADYEKITFTGTSGRVINSVTEFSKFEEPVDILEKTLLWRHLLPSAPDTLQSYPYEDSDPFAIEDCPHVYFAGNQENFNTKLVTNDDGKQKVRVIAVPDFEETRIAVMVNLKNLEVQMLAF